MDKIVGKPDTMYYNYPHAYHWNRNWGMTAEVLVFIIILPHPHQSMLGDLVRLLTTWLGSTPGDQHCVGEKGLLFLLNQTKCVNIFSMIVAATADVKSSVFEKCIDHSHIVLIIGDLNGLGHLPEFADQFSGREVLVNGPTRSVRLNGLGHLLEFADQISGRQILVNGPTRSDRRNQYNMRMVYKLVELCNFN